MSPPNTILDIEDIPSEEDEDYVPEQTSKSNKAAKRRRRDDAGSSASSSESDSDEENVEANTPRKRSRSVEDETIEKRTAREKKEADQAWKKFLEEEDGPKELVKDSIPPAEELVEIRRPRKFAGEIIYETVRLPTSHPDIKKYANVSKAGSSGNNPLPSNVNPASPLPPPTLRTAGSTADAMPKPRGPPMRKKPRQSLESMNAAIAANAAGKKMTTFEKSQIDWKSHTSALDGASSAELEANRRRGGGGFLEKQEFLSRVGERADASRDAATGGKRRR